MREEWRVNDIKIALFHIRIYRQDKKEIEKRLKGLCNTNDLRRLLLYSYCHCETEELKYKERIRNDIKQIRKGEVL